MNQPIDQDADLRSYDAEDLDTLPARKPEVVVFDIETKPLDFEQIKHLMPEFSAPSNYKDADKIAANIAEQMTKWIERAALSPMTGAVCAIGMLENGKLSAILDQTGESEAELIESFWAAIGAQTKLIGFNNKGFDLPFLIRRSWMLGVRVPAHLVPRRYFPDTVIDLMEMWCCGNREDRTSLNSAAKFFGVGMKNGDGKFFHELLASDPVAAGAYLENDILLTARVAH